MKNFKTFLAGTLAGALLVSSPAIAQSVKQLIEAELNTINVKVDGKAVDGENILYNDKTYVPLRAIAEMLGKTVNWDEDTNTASITEGYEITFNGEEVGKVGDKNILKDELEMYKVIAKAENKDATDDEIITIARKRIANDEIIINMAKDLSITIGSEFLDQYNNYIKYMNQQYSQQSGSNDSFTQLLTALGYTGDSYKRVQEIGYLKNKIIEKNGNIYAAKGDDVAKYYNDNKETFKYDGLLAKHILFSTKKDDGTDMSESEVKDVEKKAYEVYNKIKAGSDFDTLMKTYSQDPGLAQNPDGYKFTKGDMVKEFEDAAYALKIGDISQPVKSSFGYHIIKLIDKIEYADITDASVVKYINQKIADEKFNNDVTNKLAEISTSWN